VHLRKEASGGKTRRRLSPKSGSRAVKTDLDRARDFLGCGGDPPHARWPGDARIAINFNLNLEAGGEHSTLEGDQRSEDLLTDIWVPAYQEAQSAR
jgi:allantoinase